MAQPSTFALIVAAGRGARAASAGGPAKQYAMLGGQAMLGHAISRLAGHQRVDGALVVIAPGDEAAFDAVAGALDGPVRAKLMAPAAGGDTRQASVANGLEALRAPGPGNVLIHDAARPFVTDATICDVIDALAKFDGALPVLAIADTVKRIHNGMVGETIDRTGLGGAQTPQGFRYPAILAAHQRARAAGRTDFTDDAAIGEWAGLQVAALAGDPGNTKVTTPADLAAADARLSGAGQLVTRVGQGFDVHAFAPGDHVRLCGVDISHTHALKGHSDADVALHALTDALYGAIGAGDIGQHFPPSEARWAGADSARFLDHARGMITDRGGRIVHVDVTIICERPKIGPHREALVARLAALLALPEAAVSVKATTTERLGFTGRGEGIAAQAVATVAMPQANTRT